MTDIRQTSTNYIHPTDPNLLNIHKAMKFNNDGEPVVRTHVDGITLEGDVIVDTVSLSTSTLAALESINVQNTVTVTVTNFPTTSTVFQGTSPWVITGTVRVESGNIVVSNFTNTVDVRTLPAITGTISVSNFPTSFTATNFTSTVFVSNTVTISNTSFAVTNFPTTSTVYQGTDPWVITGTISLDNFPLIQEVTGTVAVIQATDPWVVTGTVFVENFTSTVYQGTDPWNVTGTVEVSNPVTEVTATISGSVLVTLTGTNTVNFPTGSNDAFGRLRVSDAYTLFDTRTRYYDHQQFSSSTSTGGTVSYNANASTFTLTVNGSSGSEVIRETKRVFPYQPGKSLLIYNTFAMAPTNVNLRQRVGFFGAQNGIYFEQAGATQYLVIRSYSSGVLQEERIDKTLWNGPDAGYTIYPEATQIFWIDVEWLGVGSVRCGFVVNGAYKLMHTFHHANRFELGAPVYTTTYMTTACLPVRYEITNTGTSGQSHSMKQICSSVISEGGYNAFSTSETAGTGITPFRLVSAGTYYPIVSIRLASSRLDSIVLPRQVDILSPTVNYYRWVLLLNPTLTGATWSGVSSTGSVEYDTAARVNAVTGGTELASGYISSRELSILGADFFSFQLGRTLSGVSDVVSIALTATSNNADVLAQIGWQEVT